MLTARGLLSPREGTFTGVRQALKIQQSQMETFSLKKSKRLKEIEKEIPPSTRALMFFITMFLDPTLSPTRSHISGNTELVLLRPQSSLTLTTTPWGRNDHSHSTDEKMEARFHDEWYRKFLVQ